MRESPRAPGQYAVSLLRDGKVFHNKVSLEGGRYVCMGYAFDSITQLVEHHKKELGNFQHLLTEAVPSPARLRRLSQVPNKRT